MYKRTDTLTYRSTDQHEFIGSPLLRVQKLGCPIIIIIYKFSKTDFKNNVFSKYRNIS